MSEPGAGVKYDEAVLELNGALHDVDIAERRLEQAQEREGRARVNVTAAWKALLDRLVSEFEATRDMFVREVDAGQALRQQIEALKDELKSAALAFEVSQAFARDVEAKLAAAQGGWASDMAWVRLNDEMSAERKIADDLYAALPKCTMLVDSADRNPLGFPDPCGKVATRAHSRGGPRYCDEHAKGEPFPDYPRAEAIRAYERSRKLRP